MFNTIEYDAFEIKKYMLDIWQCSKSPALADIKFINGKIIWDCSGCVNVKNFVKSDKRGNIMDGYSKIISAVRKTVESMLMASDYLIDDKNINLDPDFIWIDTKSGMVRLLPGKSDCDFIDRICKLASEIGSEKLAERIKERSDKSRMSIREILAILSAWELEIN